MNIYSAIYVKGNTDDITGIKNIKNAKIIINKKLLRFFSFLFLIQSRIILKSIFTKPRRVNHLEGCILYQVFCNLYISLRA